MKNTGLTVAVEGSQRTVRSSSSSSRQDWSNLGDYERPKKIRKRDFCRLCRSGTCDHCYRQEDDSSGSD